MNRLCQSAATPTQNTNFTFNSLCQVVNFKASYVTASNYTGGTTPQSATNAFTRCKILGPYAFENQKV